MIPMAISISFGVLFSSFITLFLVPASYLILDDLSRIVQRGGEQGRIAPRSEGTRRTSIGPKRSSPDRVRKSA
jgi:hypothetical protein